MRTAASLNGPWRFTVTTSALPAPASFDRSIDVPAYPQWTFPALRTFAGYFWYSRALLLPEAPPGHVVTIAFGAADYLADVWIGGVHAATHQGGYTPFEAVAPEGMHGAVEVLVRVWDAPLGGATPTPPAADLPNPRWIPRGKQSWYGECSGLWQPVRLCVRPREHLTGLRVEATADGMGVEFAAGWDAASARSLTIGVSSVDGGPELWRGSWPVEGDPWRPLPAAVFPYEAWTPERPCRYRVEATLVTATGEDVQSFVTGFRRVESTPHELRLNGRRLYLRGALDQDFSAASGYAHPGGAALEARLQAAKRAGLNLLRCHVKVPDPRYLDAADRLGLLVWHELPSWGRAGRPEERPPDWLRDEVRRTLREVAARDAHHPSLIARSILNEGWGLDLRSAVADRALLRAWAAEARAQDATRLVIDNSAMAGAPHVDTDLADWHAYAAFPQHAADFEAAVERLARRPPELWSREDARRPGDRPVALTEFGLWGLPEAVGELAPALASRPPWPRAAQGLDRAGFEARFQRSPCRTVFGSPAELRAATRAQQAEGLRRQLAHIRSTPGLAGFVLTELADQAWEANGLVSFEGADKPALGAVASVAGEHALLVRGLPPSAWSRQPLGWTVVLVSDRALRGPATVQWEVEGGSKGTLEEVLDGVAEIVTVGGVATLAPAVTAPTHVDVRVALRAGDLQLEQRERVLVIPETEQSITGKLRVCLTGQSAAIQTGTLANALAEAGVTTLTEPRNVAAQVVVGGGAAEAALVAKGLPALVLAEADDTPFLPSVPRTGRFDPNWCTAFDWIRPGVLGDLPLGPLMGTAFRVCAARRVIPALDGLLPSDVLMGTFRGWLGDEAAITAQARYGRGRIVVTTLRLAQTCRADPVSRVVLLRLLQLLVAKDCAPQTHIR
ncbi:MAG: hypothetical protein FJ029_04050 [Actinobacteria bacterium]|nr:hypothetical protein [Actinomycetota bacterium]